jgi:hypothetical protein
MSPAMAARLETQLDVLPIVKRFEEREERDAAP